MGRSFANLHIKSKNLEKTIDVLRELSEGHAEVLGRKEAQEIKEVFYISQSNENWISVLHEYFVWGTVKKIGQTLSRLTEEPVMTAAYMNEELLELSIFANGDLQAERIFCEPWTREEYEELKEERLNDDYLVKALGIPHEDNANLLKLTSPFQAVDKLSELVGISLWSEFEWIPYEETLQNQYVKYEF
ncbi:hypothetical protein [Paenibacillus radicis (ex Gao et al. 2016)]|uniref:Uncharacterized protein n=1 Tax=Paenibacillus radicis (ex Gao et al. 2016) TaxID=1737354 RepID=A0A917H796_9BACL|nr:hypothetical protein [Paenibacillus radicis (ex Gao et al. 2016)]GGG69719.1 hypothetical protein GCM10010918_26170 [Paenibacillus radicis (ex Gao et al. 2016)]